MLGRVDEIGTTGSGKPKVKISGTWIYPGRCPIEGMSRGMDVEYFTSTFQAGNTTLTGLESWAPAKPLPAAVLTTDNPVVQRKPVNPNDELTEAEMRFISNVVGQALAAKTITSPAEIRQWVLAAKAALVPQDDFEP